MDAPVTLICPNPAGELKNSPEYPSGSWPLDTPGGRFYAEWDDQAPVTREGQLIFFFQFLQAGGRWEEFLRQCPLHYTGNRGSGALNVMGTVLLSVLCGHWRYAHINGVRGDGINPGLLGMRGTVSEDAVRLAMYRIKETPGLDWLSTQILGSISPALGLPWILDVDVTVKPLYGHQQGAEIGYRPRGDTDQQRVASHPCHHGAMDRGSTMDPPANPPSAALAGRKMASRSAGRSRKTAQWMKKRPPGTAQVKPTPQHKRDAQ
jgi:hypothetical protein